MLSNETVNIWSHLLGFLLFFSLGLNDLLSVLPASGANGEDYVIYAIGLFCFQVTAGRAKAVKTKRSIVYVPPVYKHTGFHFFQGFLEALDPHPENLHAARVDFIAAV